jgi:hypothetical protein
MAEEEELWLPAVRFEKEHKNALEHLIGAGLLRYSDDRRQIGFRHQTLFDFVRARSFAARVLRLSDYVLEKQDALFVRPTLWTALRYLRDADRRGYQQHFATLWQKKNLRRHVRYLLIAFLGQVADPEMIEIGWLSPLLTDPTLKGKAFRAIEGNPGWFSKILSRLPTLMLGDSQTAFLVTGLLRRALAFDRNTSLTLIEQHWLPDPKNDSLILQSLWDLKQWDERTVRLAESIVRRSTQRDLYIRHIISAASASCPELAPRIAAAELWTALKAAEAEPVQVIEPLAEDTSDENKFLHYSEQDYANRRAVEKLVSKPTHWYGLTEVARAAPAAFIHHVWPWVCHVASKYRSVNVSEWNAYNSDRLFDIPADNDRDHTLMGAVNVAVEAFAEHDPETFLDFMDAQKDSDLLIAHRLIASRLKRLPEASAARILQYLLTDPRRLAIGSNIDVHRDTRELMTRIVPNLSETDRLSLEQHILGFEYLQPKRGAGADQRRAGLGSNRRYRPRLLWAFGRSFLSAH